MAAPINTHATGDDLNLKDDLWAPLPETVRLGGHGPFVINLSASGSPLAIPANPVQGCPQAHVYRVQRIEDGRARYRLRFGPFATEDEADAILKVVRDNYPSSLTATADAEDLRVLAAIQSKTAAVVVPAPVAAAAPPAVATAPAVPTPAVAKPVMPKPAAAKPKQTKAAPSGAKPIAAPPAGADTDAVQALKVLELEEDKDWRWYVIQLSVAEEPFDPATLPNLDIFRVYRLYCIAGIVDGRIRHALRVGFFAEQPAAVAVAGYLAAFYDKPVIKRVSATERERFAEKSLEPRKDVGTTGKQAVIEITNERFVRAARSGQSAVK
ncbi:MAG TPA: SPOR domain-containing protein [Steroidobacteraceae bacterium]